MPLSVDMRKIVKAEVVPWEIDEALYRVAYTTNEGWEGSDLIRTKAEAEAVSTRSRIRRLSRSIGR